MVDFWMTSTFGSTVTVTSFDTTSTPARVAFLDTNNSLGLGGSIIRPTSPTTWTLHLDDAISFQFDDDDNDILLQLRVAPGATAVPEPASLALAGSGALVLVGSAWRRWKRAGKAAR